MSGGAIAGAVLALLVIVAALVLLVRRRKQRIPASTQENKVRDACDGNLAVVR